jgi:hypothetical protein
MTFWHSLSVFICGNSFSSVFSVSSVGSVLEFEKRVARASNWRNANHVRGVVRSGLGSAVLWGDAGV